MDLGNDHLTLIIDNRTGGLVSLKNKAGREFIHRGSGKRPVFTLSFIDENGKAVELNANDARTCTVSESRVGDDAVATMQYASLRGLPIHVEVTMRCPRKCRFTFWTCAVEHDTPWRLDWIDFPDVVVPNDLVGSGGDARILWPGFEGVLVDDIDHREEHGMLRYEPLQYPCTSWTAGMYPGQVPSQFMAYIGANGGLYVGAHDSHGNIKGLEFRKHDGGIRLEFRLFVGAAARGRYRLPYEMAIGVFDGDWYDAGTIYRDWFVRSDIPKPPKLPDNPRVPAWLADSPVVITYPTRGTKDTGDMTPNEYFPYTKALPHIERLSEELDSPVMALLMQWEGTAPWAPPYVWPPMDEQDYRQFVARLHEKKNYAGLYCSGIGWTQQSVLTEYDRTEQFEQEGLDQHMCLAPDGTLPPSRICTFVRSGYDMCPASHFTHQTVENEVEVMLSVDLDYIQFFDQNEGGMACLCYAPHHGHPPGPGPWQVKANRAIHQSLAKIIDKTGRKVLIGCEGGAAETYLADLMFNDARFEVMYSMGTPIPLYGFLYHEYTMNFMGNQCCTHSIVDYEKSPDNLRQRIAHSFVAGDAMTVVLKGGGQIHWAWGTEWSVPAPEQQPTIALIKNLNAWRRGYGKPYLYGGRMLKPVTLNKVGSRPIVRRKGSSVEQPSLFVAAWRSADGKRAGQFVVNYTKEAQTTSFTVGERKARLVNDPKGSAVSELSPQNGEISFEVPALSAVLVEF